LLKRRPLVDLAFHSETTNPHRGLKRSKRSEDTMKQDQGKKAVVYIRVSTDPQAEDALNLDNQEERCRIYCRQKGLSVVTTFKDAGESARTSDRPEFQRMLAYCKARRNEISYVVVQDLSRFARNHRDQADAICDLGRCGVLLRSTYEPNIDETAAGKLAANILGAFNQFFSDSHSEKQQDRKRQAVAGGRVPWRAPIGYVNVSSKTGANIEPDPQRAPLIIRAFELVSAGLHKKSEVLRIVASEGLTTRTGKPIASQSFDHILTNPIYAGWVWLPSDPDTAPVRGLHKPLITQELFDRVQAVIDGRKPFAVARRKVNPEFPLRRLVHCEPCGTPLTGAFCRGRSGSYPRYWCRQKGCRRVSTPKAALESTFLKFLGRLQPNREVVADFPKIAARVWEAKQGGSEREARSLKSQLEAQKERKNKLLTMRMDGEISREEFEEAKTAAQTAIYKIEEKLRFLESNLATAESFGHFAELQLTDMAKVWRIASPEQRERVQNLLFQGGLDYSPETGFLNRSKSSLFHALETVNIQDANLVEAVGVEPTSEKTSNREHSCFFQFIFVSSSTLRTDKDAATTSLIGLVRPAQTEQGRPAYCATIGTGP
jgi:site-specific DNA recombinase